jgi:hypothetical protein
MVTRTLHVFIGEARASRVSFRLARDSVRPVVQELQRRTGRVVDFDFIEDCVEAKSQEECGYGDPSELKGRSTVFLDVGGSAAEQSRQRIRSVIEAARLGLRFVSTADEGSVILVFSLDQGRCDPPPQGCAPDSAVGEAYVSVSAGLKVVMLFDRERSTAFSPGLAGGFAGDFVKAYKRANGLR